MEDNNNAGDFFWGAGLGTALTATVAIANNSEKNRIHQQETAELLDKCNWNYHAWEQEYEAGQQKDQVIQDQARTIEQQTRRIAQLADELGQAQQNIERLEKLGENKPS